MVVKQDKTGYQFVEREGLLNEFLLRSILDVHAAVFQEFWELGGVHADPHLKNFIVGMDRQQNWQVWIIKLLESPNV